MALSAEKAARKAGKGPKPPAQENTLEGWDKIIQANGKKSKKAKHAQRGKDNGEAARDAAPVAAAIVEQVKEAVAADHAVGHEIKKLRDSGMAWWQIAYQLELPGSGPNVASGKSGAARARALYKKTFGSLPGDVAARSTKASRAAGESTVPVGRRKCVFSEAALDPEGTALADEEIIEAIKGKHIRWLGSIPYGFEPGALISEREARVHAEDVKITRNEHGPMIHFREMDLAKKDRRAEAWRSVYAADVYDIRR